MVNQFSEIGFEERSPEKAGVGGSIPSLATMFSSTYRHPGTLFFNDGNNTGTFQEPVAATFPVFPSISFHISRAVFPVFAM